MRVAGPASLVVAKAIKIQERVADRRADRVSSKDAGDLLRLLRNVAADTIGARLRVLTRDHAQAAPIVEAAIQWLDEQST